MVSVYIHPKVFRQYQWSLEKGSDAVLYPLDAAEVREIIQMNRNGIKPESLKSEPEPSAPEFVTAVGDDSISRFDRPRRGKSRNRGRRDRGGAGKAGK